MVDLMIYAMHDWLFMMVFIGAILSLIAFMVGN